VDLYIHSPIRLHGIALNLLSKWKKTLPYLYRIHAGKTIGLFANELSDIRVTNYLFAYRKEQKLILNTKVIKTNPSV
jgi:hypothetical protein